ncbi:peptide chain release factor N(5)-glutamine methyltransferase [Oceanobacillus jordanicus]|uniref:Release factor glutamine methyltransferase n=1 Tax=Oceanobacillus jordanicus TaxID=2867266 RepID=A0AAW5AZQ8_9BACI|nr:peptide chain release factor N(5)-glutamine methyltransferase [Oceanobacillus jordanicus]MCG3417921.1 peptide chain release factor N(5)-glutamine methyltransferase [Oceanobacillus jordanicus]
MHNRKQYEVLKWASLFLEEHQREARVAQLLLQHHLGKGSAQFYADMQETVPEALIERYAKDIEEHAHTGVPIQHLIGKESFYGRDFNVNANVLIPRMETEELVQHVLHSVSTDAPLNIVDVGTGSGIIAITLALELPNATVYATDLSHEALAVAQHNATQLGAEVTFSQGNFLQPLQDANVVVDVLVSNPPYIARSEATTLSDTVKNFDPELALYAEEEGLAAYREIVKQAKGVLKHEGMMAVEIGHSQADAVTALIKQEFPSYQVRTVKDINGKDRIISTAL